MTLSPDDMDILEKRYAMYVILAIDSHPMSTKTEIMRLGPGNEKTKFQRINELIDIGLIEYREAEGYSTKRLVLSEEGRKMATKIKKIRYQLLAMNGKGQDVAHKPDDDFSE